MKLRNYLYKFSYILVAAYIVFAANLISDKNSIIPKNIKPAVESVSTEIIYPEPYEVEAKKLSVLDTSNTSKVEETSEIIIEVPEHVLIIDFIQKETELPYESCEMLYNKVGNHEHLSVPIMLGLYWTESGFDPSLVNENSDATGIAQFLPSSAEWLAGYLEIDYSYEYLFDPTYSINLSVELLNYLLDNNNNDLVYSLDYYNGCDDGSYSSKVLKLSEEYDAKLNEYIELNKYINEEDY